MSCKIKIYSKLGGVVETAPEEINCFFKGLKVVSNSNESNLLILHEGTQFYSCIFNINDGSKVEIGKSRYGINNLTIHSKVVVVKIGQDFSCWGVNLRVQEKGSLIEIGNDCMFSSDILIYASDIHAILDLGTGKVINRNRPIVIDNHVWVGRNVNILKGVYLPENTVVGMGSVVTRGFKYGNISVGGNPARILKTNVNWKRQHVDSFEEWE